MSIELSVVLGSDTIPMEGGEVTCEAVVRTDLDRSAADRPKHLALCIDSSKSMKGKKVRNAKQGIKRAVDFLDDRDYISIVEFSFSASRVLDPTQCGGNRRRIKEKVETIETSGGTNIIDGMEEARKALEGKSGVGLPKRILGSDNEEMLKWLVLVSDGKPSNPSQMVKSLIPTSTTLERHVAVAEKFADARITIQSLGVGSNYNEDIMRGVAEATRGNPGHISDSSEIEAFFREIVKKADSVVEIAPNLRIIPRGDVSVGEIYQREPRLNEFDPVRSGGALTVELPPIAADVEQTVLIEVEAPPGEDGTERLLLDVELKGGGDVVSDSAVVEYRYEDDGGNLTLQDQKRIDTKARRLAMEESSEAAIAYLDKKDEDAVLDDTRVHVKRLQTAEASGDSKEEKELKNELTKPGLTKSSESDTGTTYSDATSKRETRKESEDSSGASPAVDTDPTVDTDEGGGNDRSSGTDEGESDGERMDKADDTTRLIPIPETDSVTVGDPVTITVRDGLGSRVSGVEVEAGPVSATTDDRGRCRITFDAPGRYNIEPAASDGSGYEGEVATVTIESG